MEKRSGVSYLYAIPPKDEFVSRDKFDGHRKRSPHPDKFVAIGQQRERDKHVI
jgi:hypothetical protein